MTNSPSYIAVFILCATLAGCADSDSESLQPVDVPITASNQESKVPESLDLPVATDIESDEDFAPLSLGPIGGSKGSGTGPSSSQDSRVADVINKLKPLQIMLGKWRGTTRKDFDGFKAVDSHEWIWDLQTDAAQPALVARSDKSPYLRTARLTWDQTRGSFLLTATDKDGKIRDFEGEFAEPVREIIGPDDKLHRVFKLRLTQTEESQASVGGEHWQLALAQQENDRYLLEVDRRRGKASFKRYDTVSTQRDGTSFAMSDSDYGDKTCIISQGLGTIAVSFQGKTYWVCCTGCKAAFEEDPETWIARAEKAAKSN